jgi:DNA ligase 1
LVNSLPHVRAYYSLNTGILYTPPSGESKSRISIVNILTNTFRLVLRNDPPGLLPSLYLLSNSLAPPYSPIELGIGSSVISKAIQHVSGLTPAALKRLYNQSGDPGDVAFAAKSNVRTLIPHPALRVRGVYDTLLRIAHTKGTGAARSKQALVEKLLVAARGEEARFLVRTLVQNLRVGAVRTSILTALARAATLTPAASAVPPSSSSRFAAVPDLLRRAQPVCPAVAPGKSKKKTAPDEARDALAAVLVEAEALVKQVFVQHPSYDDLASALLEAGLEGLAERVRLSVGTDRVQFGPVSSSSLRLSLFLGIPLHPTLGSPTRSLDEIYERLQDLPFTAEFKYDGQRAQIHASRGEDGALPLVKLFSRHLEDMTEKVRPL